MSLEDYQKKYPNIASILPCSSICSNLRENPYAEFEARFGILDKFGQQFVGGVSRGV